MPVIKLIIITTVITGKKYNIINNPPIIGKNHITINLLSYHQPRGMLMGLIYFIFFQLQLIMIVIIFNNGLNYNALNIKYVYFKNNPLLSILIWARKI